MLIDHAMLLHTLHYYCVRWDVEKHAAVEAERQKQQQEKAKLRALGLGCQWEGTVYWQVYTQ
jgi:hypothetical protein